MAKKLKIGDSRKFNGHYYHVYSIASTKSRAKHRVKLLKKKKRTKGARYTKSGRNRYYVWRWI